MLQVAPDIQKLESIPVFQHKPHAPGTSSQELLVCGLNHVRANLALREGYALTADQALQVLRLIREREIATQAVVLSTCNRTELYIHAPEHQAADRLRDLFLELGGGHELVDGPPPIYQYAGIEAVRHLFAVAAGLDSMILGENQVKHQLRLSVEQSQAAGCMGTELHRVMEAAFHAGKRIRTETGLNDGALGLGKAAVLRGEQELGGLAGRTCLIIGAGKIGKLAAEALAQRQPKNLWIVNRSPSHAAEIVRRVGGEAFGLDALPDLLRHAELILGTAYSPDLLLTRKAYIQYCGTACRPEKVCMIDIAMPRILDTELAEVPGVRLYNMEAMEDIAHENYSRRLGERGKAWSIVEAEVERYAAARRTRELSEPIRRLKEKLSSVLLHETNGLRKLLPPDSDGALEMLQHRLRQRLLHEVIEEMKALN